MTHQVERSFEVAAHAESVWAFFWNIEGVARCIPGCADVTVTEPGKCYRALVKRKLGPFVVGIDLAIDVLERDPPRRIRVAVTGDDRKLKTQVRQTIALALCPLENGHTTVDLAASFEIQGVLASLGKNLISMQVEQVLDDFVATLKSELEGET
jgi:hypothetical protein